MIARDEHVHLQIASAERAASRATRGEGARRAVVALAAGAAASFGASFFLPWWHFWLYAPQYPKGLELVIALTGMSGDVHEIDLLNHYIGMQHLENAAPIERRLAGYGVAAIALLTLVLLTASGRRLNKLVALPAIAFPLVFLADSFAWLHAFGHHLNPHAPLRVAAFTPEMFGNGKIGQFETFAEPAVGFWLALAGVACALVAAFLRARVCAGCARAGSCRAVCARGMALRPPARDRADAP